MGLFPEFSGKRARLAFIVAGLLLVGYISLLVGMNYVSRARLEDSALEQFRQDIERRATAIGYFFSERENDLKGLAASRAVSAFFENKALGMSMEYGLRASLFGIAKNFDRLLTNRKLDRNRIFDRIILVDSYGKPLVESRQQGVKEEQERGWKDFLTPENPDATTIILQDGQSLRLVVSAPCFFKKRYAAQIVAWISPGSLCRLVEAEGESPKRSVFIVSGKALFLLRSGLSHGGDLTDLPNLDTLETGKTYWFDTVNNDGARMDIIAVRVPIKDTPFSLVSLVPAVEVRGPMALWHLPVAMGILAIFILCGIVFAFQINAHRLILHARLEETSKREQEIQNKNLQLELEIANRERAEDALRKAQEELEIKIRERTRELIESNRLLKREIKQREQAEETIRESEARYRSVFESTGTATLIIEEDTTISMANTEFEKLSGYSKKELEGRMCWTEFVAREDLERMKEYHARRRWKNGSEAPREYEFRFVDKHGNVKHILNKAAIIPGTGKSVASLLDITARKLGEEELEREKEKFRVLAEKSPLGISIVREDGRYKYINPKFIEIFGYAPEEIPTEQDLFRRAFPDKDEREQVVSSWMSDLKRLRRGEVRVRTFTATCKDGFRKVIHFRAVTTEKGDKFVICEDITEKRHLEVQLQHSQKMEAVGTLAGGIAHDFNNLLQVIYGYTQILLMQDHMIPEDVDKLKTIRNSTMKASELIKRLLIFSRKVESDLRPMDLNHEVKEACKLLERTIPRMIDIEFQPVGGLKMINGDPVQIQQVIMNLGINARDAMPEGGQLVIEAKNIALDEECSKAHLGVLSGEYVLLSISDTGSGMDKETIKHIFEPFFTTKETGKGTGLGLAMVYGIVKNHNGYIACYSAPGKGTTFKIYFPVMQSEITGFKEEKRKQEIWGGKETILIVDDEKEILDIGKNMLTRFGYEVITARSGEEAIQIIRETKPPPELVILDLNMPGMGGHKCLDKLLEIDPGMRVIIASGYLVADNVRQAVDSGASGFIGKPYQLADMLRKVREVLGLPQREAGRG